MRFFGRNGKDIEMASRCRDGLSDCADGAIGHGAGRSIWARNKSQTVADACACPKVSVLVPIYNTPEPMLRQCLDSLVGQTLRDIEIIAINDGSTTSVPRVIREYADRDARIRVLDKPNSGYGDSMNKGIAIANGEFIGICEPDDFADRRMFADLHRAARRYDADIVKSNFIEHFDGEDGKAPHEHLAPIFDAFPYKKPFAPADNLAVVRVMPAIWAAIYRRSMLVDNGIRFSSTPGASFQDTGFVQQCWISARRVVLLKKGYLHYRMDNAASSSKSGAKVMAVCGEYERTFEFLRNRGAEALETFGPILNAMRFDGYTWNYDRISPEHHMEFALRWAQDMREQMQAGLVDEGLLSPRYRKRLALLLESPEEFCAAHPDGIDL